MYQIQGKYLNNFALLNKVVLFVAIILIGGQIGFSQGTRGTITDPNQAIVPNATVKLVDTTKGTEVRSVQTDDDGSFQFIEIEPSTYNIIVTASNFPEFKANDIKVEPKLGFGYCLVSRSSDQRCYGNCRSRIDRPRIGDTRNDFSKIRTNLPNVCLIVGALAEFTLINRATFSASEIRLILTEQAVL